MYEQLFLMYVIPSVMVQSYICYVTKPIVEVELSKFCYFSLILTAKGLRSVIEGSEGKGQRFDGSKAFYTKDRSLTK